MRRGPPGGSQGRGPPGGSGAAGPPVARAAAAMQQQVGKVRSATQAAAAPLVQKASEGVRALLRLVSSSESSYFVEGEQQAAQIRQQLASSSTELKLAGLRRVLAAEAAAAAAAATGPSPFFADVLKNLSTPDFELKRLVYLYLVLHAQEAPDLALLALNGYQKDLCSSSHVLRAAALKSLSSLQLLEAAQLLLHSLRRAAADTSPLVRKTAAHAAAKLFFLDADQRHELVLLLLQLLADGELAVAGAALVSFRLVFFQSLQASPGPQGGPQGGPHGGGPPGGPQGGPGGPLERGGAPETQEEASSSSSTCSSSTCSSSSSSSSGSSGVSPPRLSSVAFLASRSLRGAPLAAGEGLEPAQGPSAGGPSGGTLGAPGGAPGGAVERRCKPLPRDFERFVAAAELLLSSDSAAVVASACAAVQQLLPASCWGCVVSPLLRCLYTCGADLKELLLRVVHSFAAAAPWLFQQHLREFFVKQGDCAAVRQQKLLLLLLLGLADAASLPLLLPELRVYVHWDGDAALAAAACRALTLLALQHQQAQGFCLRQFAALLDSRSAAAAAEAVVGVRTLVQQQQLQQDDAAAARLVLQLAAQLQRRTAAAARASVIWLLGRHHQQLSWLAADALRQLIRGFREEAEEVKLQLLLLATRLWAFHRANAARGPPQQQQQQQQQQQLLLLQQQLHYKQQTPEEQAAHLLHMDGGDEQQQQQQQQQHKELPWNPVSPALS
ncbi:adaptin N terminal region domain-containing protein, putative [Eimeria tenella]|uniref:Adaptin N terminal region domain-containing protein, putative n=1 Tax=Eimeria tenella TaxID=5802 RepID=U6KWF8_EIMTE|nr:adaptin N terminal region domain-containing protein, putative [Eimeria tenella]CDJ41263.1 adaptin N terminal region domain-containing protein, putative [Eimeria tenella]|eukprot:XP_013232013.1 adaptin N terminal region domain-containing protein, putative [Eimeria tenella]